MEPSSPEPAGSVLIPELPSEVALDILVRLPRIVQARLRLVCRAWHDAMEPAAMSSLRKMRCVSEVWPVEVPLLSATPLFTVVDPLLHRTHNISHPPQLRSHASCLHVVLLSNIGKEVLIAALPSADVPFKLALELQGLYSFDGARMKWKDSKYSSLPRNLELGMIRRQISMQRDHTQLSILPHEFWTFVADMDNSYLYVVGAHCDMERLDLKSKLWETLPHTHVQRRCAAGVMLQGNFYMMGGYNCECLNSGEIWDPVSGKWTLVPELRPYEVFGRDPALSRVAVVKDQLYALKGVPFSTGFSEELMYYETSSKLWISLGYIPLRGHNAFRLVGMDQELWVLIDGSMTFLASKPSLSQPLSWRILATNSEVTVHDGKSPPQLSTWLGAMLV